MNLFKRIFCTCLVLFSIQAIAAITVPVYLVNEGDEPGKSVGSVVLENSLCGVLITPNLHDLPAGVHGFHVHEKPSCADKGMAAGGHLDPADTKKHEGPFEHGHLGDLPVLIVDDQGRATMPTLAPRFKLEQLKGHSLMIHAGGDNYSDQPEKLGGGGDRIACGVIG